MRGRMTDQRTTNDGGPSSRMCLVFFSFFFCGEERKGSRYAERCLLFFFCGERDDGKRSGGCTRNLLTPFTCIHKSGRHTRKYTALHSCRTGKTLTSKTRQSPAAAASDGERGEERIIISSFLACGAVVRGGETKKRTEKKVKSFSRVRHLSLSVCVCVCITSTTER